MKYTYLDKYIKRAVQKEEKKLEINQQVDDTLEIY